MAMEALFWVSVAFILYVYAGYPALLAVSLRLRRSAASAGHVPGRSAASARHVPGRPEAPSGRAADRSTTSTREARLGKATDLPGVSVIIAARNEAHHLPSRIDNLLASDYPAQRLEIIVASDGSTDNTASVLAPYAGRIRLLMLPPSGKAGALNAAVLRAANPILVFGDARQRFAPDAIRRLAQRFQDPTVGAVSGELMLDCERAAVAKRSSVGDGVGAYWRYEKWVRNHEALLGSAVGVSGAIYAMRRWLWQPLPIDAILDDVLGPMRLVQRGFRVGFEPAARAFDRVSDNASAEMRRKVRTLAGNFQLLRYEPRLLVPGRNPLWLQFMSHKLARLLVPHALIALLASSLWLATTSAIYAVALALQVGFYGLALYGAILDRRTRLAPAAAAEAFREAA
jgi:cellulose synthase/poly-beta-1,6-N-acetylglucosamine synthase-like glycosyltransferase